jgi:hypothetical protein
MDYIIRYLNEVGQTLRALPHDRIRQAIDILNQAWEDGKQISVMGK